eukprot:6198777-Pleurochrysis_carterae.AAC.1
MGSGADPEPGHRPGPQGRGGLEPTAPFNSHSANYPGKARKRQACLFDSAPRAGQCYHSSSEIARLPGPKFLLSLPSGNRAYVSMPATSVATVAPQARSLPQASNSSRKTPAFSGMRPTQVSQAFVQSCNLFPPALHAKFIAQEQDRLQQDALQQVVPYGRKPGALAKRSVEAVYTPSLSQECRKLPHSNSFA